MLALSDRLDVVDLQEVVPRIHGHVAFDVVSTWIVESHTVWPRVLPFVAAVGPPASSTQVVWAE